jgi:UDP-N-acetyl-D-glucosamine dehydrogenase
MPEHVVAKIGDLLNEERTAVNGARVLLIGVAYKADVSDMRESPALDVLRLLDEKGADLRYHDPHVPELAIDGRSWKSVELTDEELAAADLVVILTDHTSIDWGRVVVRSQRVYDTRNATRGVRDGREKIRKL